MKAGNGASFCVLPAMHLNEFLWFFFNIFPTQQVVIFFAFMPFFLHVDFAASSLQSADFLKKTYNQ